MRCEYTCNVCPRVFHVPYLKLTLCITIETLASYQDNYHSLSEHLSADGYLYDYSVMTMQVLHFIHRLRLEKQ